ncbi:MAG: hypothetical protein JOY60_07695 [Burkholderiaceae bacterium]|nr:hypothetical protein [Roseateles sp.]MBV8469724.1 hypothetical protein [Burkholderiaceae bacterium]
MNQPTDLHPELDRVHAAVEHVRELLASDNIPINAAEGLLLGLVSVIGTLTGDPQLPAHIRGSYDGLLELSRELLWKIRSGKE